MTSYATQVIESVVINAQLSMENFDIVTAAGVYLAPIYELFLITEVFIWHKMSWIKFGRQMSPQRNSASPAMPSTSVRLQDHEISKLMHGP